MIVQDEAQDVSTDIMSYHRHDAKEPFLNRRGFFVCLRHKGHRVKKGSGSILLSSFLFFSFGIADGHA